MPTPYHRDVVLMCAILTTRCALYVRQCALGEEGGLPEDDWDAGVIGGREHARARVVSGTNTRQFGLILSRAGTGSFARALAPTKVASVPTSL